MLGPDLMGMIATSYGVGAAGAVLLQARQIVHRRSSCDVSARFFATYAGGYGIWLLYGLSIGSLPLVLVDAAGLLCGLLTLAVTLRMRGSLLRPRTWGRCRERHPPAVGAA
jgi:MtN3 and saliva related transmembrane protein